MEPLTTFTTEQIFALAPDAASIKGGKEQASLRKWTDLGSDRTSAWGLCQGSAKVPYQTIIDLSGPAFRCSCPSRKFPCKHSLGLFLLLAGQPQEFKESPPPDWVQEWLAARRKGDEQKVVTASEKKARDPAAQVKRAAVREARVQAGIEDLELWLRDLVRGGLAAAQNRSTRDWENVAARLVDAQAPGLARRVREMATIPASGEGWQDRLLAQAASLFLLVQGLKRLDQMPAELQADLRGQAGWQQSKESLLEQAGVQDNWQVLGQQIEEEIQPAASRGGPLRILRTWLWGVKTGRSALLLDFAPRGQPLESGLVPGTSLLADLVYYSGAYPLRAFVCQRLSAPTPIQSISGYPTIKTMLEAYAKALSANPWAGPFPASLLGVVPYRIDGVMYVKDIDERCLPINRRCRSFWQLLALSGGYPMDLFGEWDGQVLSPVSCFAGAWIGLE